MHSHLGKAVLLSLLLSMQAPSADSPPEWLKNAASAALPNYEEGTPAAVLLKEQKITVEPSGRLRSISRYAVLVLSREGRVEAQARQVYWTDGGKIRSLKGWLLGRNGLTRSYGERHVADMAAVGNDVYNEVRVMMLSAAEHAVPGSVFGYEVISEDYPIFAQLEWHFQARLPVLVSRLSLTVPQGWRVDGVTFNHDSIPPAINGSTYTWELRNLTYIAPEASAPQLTNLAPRLAISYFPPPGAATGGPRVLETWTAVSEWLTELNEPQSHPDSAISAKAAELAGQASTEYERVQAIASYVQSMNYISVQTGIGRGGGYRPHPASDVFHKSYGDCKDKVNLMRAMLRAIGIQSFPVAIYSGDSTYVRREWPSPQQFNHAVIAIKLLEQQPGAAVVEHPELGQLLIFDPTDPHTPAGRLPDHEQGGLALLAAGSKGLLMRMPTIASDRNVVRRDSEIRLGADGSVAVRIMEERTGRFAADGRSEFRQKTRPEYLKMIETWVTRSVPGAQISLVESSDQLVHDRFKLDIEFTAPGYGRLIRNLLLVFQPAAVSRREIVFLTETSRRHDIVFRSSSSTDTTRIFLPPGFEMDEMPESFGIEAPFGSYVTTSRIEGNQLSFTRTLILHEARLPAADYASVREFFERVLFAEEAPVILVRK
jgi:hypothetical protein